MAYSDIIDATNPNYRWDFNTGSTDQIGPADGTDTVIAYNGIALCEDATNSAVSSTIGSRISIANTTGLNNSAQARKSIAGWFMTNTIQVPPKRIYGEGTEALCFHFPMSLGNNVMFEVVDSTFAIQIYGIVLLPNRAYHLCGTFEGTAYANEVRFFIDGVEQLSANPTNRQPNVATLSPRGVAEFSDPVGTVGIGGGVIILNGNVNGYYNQWVGWNNASAVLSATVIREELFEKGALASITITSDTESNMQSALSTYFNTIRPNEPLNIRVEPLSGGGDFTLDASGLTFDELASIHIQYTGSDTLSWRNDKLSDASIFSTPNNGSVTVFNQTEFTITNLRNPSEVRIYDAGTINEIVGQEDVTTGTFSADLYEDLVDIMIVSLNYKIIRLTSVDTSSNITLSITQYIDNVFL